MKLLPIAILLVLSSCGDYKITESGSLVGKQVSLESLTSFTGRDLTAINSVCTALQSKEADLANISVSSFKFDVIQTDCNQSRALYSSDVTINIANKTFIKDAGVIFPFVDIETTQQGVLKDICSDPSVNGVPSAGRITSVKKTFATCPTDDECLVVTKASVSDLGALVTSEDLIHFRVKPQRAHVGFFTYRKLTARGICPEKQLQSSEVTLNP